MTSEDLMRSSVYVWLMSTYENLAPPSSIYGLADGEFLNKFMSNIAPAHFTVSRLNRDVGDDPKLRVDNLNILLRNISLYYEEQLNSVLVTSLPDIRMIGTTPHHYCSVTELEKILDLMLGVAVQCEQKTFFVEKLQGLPEEIQGDLMLKIKNVTEKQNIVFSNEVNADILDIDELKFLYESLTKSLKGLAAERNDLHERYIKVSQERDDYLLIQLQNKSRRSTISINDSFSDRDSRPNTPSQSIEVTELRQRIYTVEDELAQRSEELLRLHAETKTNVDKIAKLKNENRNLYEDAQSARIYRDELDILRTKADKLDKYESDIPKYRDKLEDMEYTKMRLKKEKEKNELLEETIELLKKELATCETIQQALISEEEKNITMKLQLEELRAEKEYCDIDLQELRNSKKLIELECNHNSSLLTQMQKEIDDLTNTNNEFRLMLLEKDNDSNVGFVPLEKELGDHDKSGATPIVDKWQNVTCTALPEEHNDAMISKIKRLEMDNIHFKKQVDTLKEHNNKLQVLEENNQEYNKQSEITRLADEITLGKSQTDALQAKLTNAYDILKEMGIDTDKLSEARPISDRQKFLEFEKRLKGGIERDLKTKGERVSVLEERLGDTRSTNTSLRKELDIIKKQNKGFKLKNKSLQTSLDETMASIEKSEPIRRISKGVQYDHVTSLTSTPIKQRASIATLPGGINSYLNFSTNSGIDQDKSSTCDDSCPKFTGSSEILSVTYEEASLSESQVALCLLKQDVEELKDENERLFTEKEQLEQEIQEFNNTQTRQLKEIKTLKKQTADLIKELDEIQIDLTAAQNELCKMSELQVAYHDLEKQLETAKAMMRELEEENNFNAGQTNKLLMQNQQLLIRTFEEKEKYREDQRAYQEHVASLKQENISMSLALTQKDHGRERKKKGLLTLFTKKVLNKHKNDGERTGPTTKVDDYLDQLSLDSGRMTPPDYEPNGFFVPTPNEFPGSDTSSRTMSGDRISYDRGSDGSLARVFEAPLAYGNRGIARTMSTDNERRDRPDNTLLHRTNSTRSKKSDSFPDLVPRVEPRNMTRPLPPGTLYHRSHLGAQSPQSNHSLQSSSHSTTDPPHHENQRSVSAEPSAFRTVNQSLQSRPSDARSQSVQNSYPSNNNSSNNSSSNHNSSRSSRGYNGDVSRGLHDEDIENSTYYEYGCV